MICFFIKNTTANNGKVINSSGFPHLTKKYNRLTANEGITIQIQKVEKRSLIVSLAIAKTPCYDIVSVQLSLIVLCNAPNALFEANHMKLWIPLPCTLESSP
jgi:hypothetical protein